MAAHYAKTGLKNRQATLATDVFCDLDLWMITLCAAVGGIAR